MSEAAEIRAVLERAKGCRPERTAAREHALVITKLEEALMWAQRRDQVVREEEPRAESPSAEAGPWSVRESGPQEDAQAAYVKALGDPGRASSRVTMRF